MSDFPHINNSKKDPRPTVPMYPQMPSNYLEDIRTKYNYSNLTHIMDPGHIPPYHHPSHAQNIDPNFPRNYLHRPQNPPTMIRPQRPNSQRRQTPIREPMHNMQQYSPRNIPPNISPHGMLPPHTYPPFSQYPINPQPHKYISQHQQMHNLANSNTHAHQLSSVPPYPSYALSSQSQPPKPRALHPQINHLPITRPDFETFHRRMTEKQGIAQYHNAEIDPRINYRYGYSAQAYERIPHPPAPLAYQQSSEFRAMYYPHSVNPQMSSMDNKNTSPPKNHKNLPIKTENNRSPLYKPKYDNTSIPPDFHNENIKNEENIYPEQNGIRINQEIEEIQKIDTRNDYKDENINHNIGVQNYNLINELTKITLPEIKNSEFDNKIKIKHNTMSTEDAKFRMRRFYQGFEEYIEFNKDLSNKNLNLLRNIESKINPDESKKYRIPVKIDICEEKMNDIQMKLSRMHRIINEVFNPYDFS